MNNKRMSEHRRNILVTDCLEANAHYNSMVEYTWHEGKRDTLKVTANSVIAEAYLMRSETIVNS
jgi:hypothetical protein